MAESHPAWVTGINDFEARLASGAMIVPQGVGDQLDPLRVRSGIRDAPGFPGRITFDQNKVMVSPFQAVIQDPARPGQGAYLVTLDAPKELALTAADPALGRVDLVIAEIVTADPGFSVHVATGQPSASPQPPTVTNPLALTLAQIQVPAGGATPTIADRRQFTAALSGILPVSGTADRPANAPSSQFLYRLDTGVLEVQQAGGWGTYRPPRRSVDWLPVVFQNNWGNFASGYVTAGYTITEDGLVRVQGLVKKLNNDTNTTGTIFTLPDGYRPADRHMFTQWSRGRTARVDVLANGEVQANVDGAPDPAWLTLDGIAFAPGRRPVPR
jgi:hypothetical protein